MIVNDSPIKISKVDFFSLDVEGYKLEALKGIYFPTINFSLFCIEIQKKFNLFTPINTLLANTGYVMIDQLTDHNYFFKFKCFKYV